MQYAEFPVYAEFYSKFVFILDELEPALRDIGVKIIRDTTSFDLARLFESHRVVVLFSHWEGANQEFPLGAIELSGGLVDIDAIVHAVPEDFDGFFDLCACFPEKLVEALVHDRPLCHVKFIRMQAAPDLLLYFYGELFQLLHEQPMPYPDALARIRAKLIGETDEGGPA